MSITHVAKKALVPDAGAADKEEEAEEWMQILRV